MEQKSVKRYSLAMQVSDSLEHMIEDGEYQVGEKIPTETELMNKFSVSRNTLREAIRALASAGVLEVRQGDGTYVRLRNRFAANIHQELSSSSEHDIDEVRNMLEISIVSLACRHRTDDDVALLELCLKRRSLLDAVTKENTEADLEFHSAIARCTHNKIMCDLYNSVSGYVMDNIAQRTQETSVDDATIDCLHEDLFIAIKQQDARAAVNSMQKILNI